MEPDRRINMEPSITSSTVTKKTEIGLDENIEGALCYALGFITGIIFLVMEKDNKFVRFHAIQSILTSLPLMVIGWLISSFMVFSLSMIWLLGMVLSLWSFVELILWLVLMLKAYQGEMFKLPIVGDIAEKQVKS
jgi:uncharacterized membrane protein